MKKRSSQGYNSSVVMLAQSLAEVLLSVFPFTVILRYCPWIPFVSYLSVESVVPELCPVNTFTKSLASVVFDTDISKLDCLEVPLYQAIPTLLIGFSEPRSA